jgi:hypothetical protein
VNDFAAERLSPLAPGLLLGLLAVLFGFGMGGAFGAAQNALKAGLKARGAAGLDSAYGGDEAAMTKVVRKSWSYYERAHLHANAPGTTALAAILLLSLVGTPGLLERIGAVAFGAGTLLYGVYWLLAGMRAPGMGSTGAARESLAFIAIPGSGLCMIGLFVTIYVLVTRVMMKKARSPALSAG